MRAGRGSHADGQEQRARYIELRQSGLSRESAATEMGLYGNDRTVYRYEHWLQAVSSGAEIVPGKPGRPRGS